MERLTKLNKLSGEIERNGLPQQLYKKLWEYEEAEEQGLLIKSPLKVGDIAYYVTLETGAVNRYRIRGMEFRRRDIGYLGYTIFATEEEARTLIKDYLSGERNYHVDNS